MVKLDLIKPQWVDIEYTSFGVLLLGTHFIPCCCRYDSFYEVLLGVELHEIWFPVLIHLIHYFRIVLIKCSAYLEIRGSKILW